VWYQRQGRQMIEFLSARPGRGATTASRRIVN